VDSALSLSLSYRNLYCLCVCVIRDRGEALHASHATIAMCKDYVVHFPHIFTRSIHMLTLGEIKLLKLSTENETRTQREETVVCNKKKNCIFY
jgi:hypothetical protein